MNSLANKVIAITGGASGIGLAVGKLLANRGAILSICDVSKDNLKSAVSDIEKGAKSPQGILTTQCDVRDSKQVDSWIHDIVGRFGKLDGAANLAGVHGLAPITQLEDSQWDRIIGVNLTGVFNCTRAQLRAMRPHSNCSIVNAASVAGLRGMAGNGAYCASKHGVIGLTRSAAAEHGADGIRVNAIAPGYIRTPMTEQLVQDLGREVVEVGVHAQPLARWAEAKEVAEIVAFLLSEESSFVTGSVYTVDGGFTAN